MLDASLTIPQVAARFGAPDWKVRRIVDSLGIVVQRAGLYRLIPSSMLGSIADELRRQGWPVRDEDANPKSD
jgi:hypothetical protein